MAAVAIGGLALGDQGPCPIKHAFVELGALPPLIDMVSAVVVVVGTRDLDLKKMKGIERRFFIF